MSAPRSAAMPTKRTRSPKSPIHPVPFGSGRGRVCTAMPPELPRSLLSASGTQQASGCDQASVVSVGGKRVAFDTEAVSPVDGRSRESRWKRLAWLPASSGRAVTSPLRAHPCSPTICHLIVRGAAFSGMSGHARPDASSRPPAGRSVRPVPRLIVEPPECRQRRRFVARVEAHRLGKVAFDVRIGEARVPANASVNSGSIPIRSISPVESAHVRRAPKPGLACRSAGETAGMAPAS